MHLTARRLDVAQLVPAASPGSDGAAVAGSGSDMPGASPGMTRNAGFQAAHYGSQHDAQAGNAAEPATRKSKGLRFGPALMARLDALAAITEVPGQLTRRYLEPAHISMPCARSRPG